MQTKMRVIFFASCLAVFTHTTGSDSDNNISQQSILEKAKMFYWRHSTAVTTAGCLGLATVAYLIYKSHFASLNSITQPLDHGILPTPPTPLFPDKTAASRLFFASFVGAALYRALKKMPKRKYDQNSSSSSSDLTPATTLLQVRIPLFKRLKKIRPPVKPKMPWASYIHYIDYLRHVQKKFMPQSCSSNKCIITTHLESVSETCFIKNGYQGFFSSMPNRVTALNFNLAPTNDFNTLQQYFKNDSAKKLASEIIKKGGYPTKPTLKSANQHQHPKSTKPEQSANPPQAKKQDQAILTTNPQSNPSPKKPIENRQQADNQSLFDTFCQKIEKKGKEEAYVIENPITLETPERASHQIEIKETLPPIQDQNRPTRTSQPIPIAKLTDDLVSKGPQISDKPWKKLTWRERIEQHGKWKSNQINNSNKNR